MLALLSDECQQTLPVLADYDELQLSIPARYAKNTPSGRSSVDNPYYARWPQLRDARLFLGLGDGACANIGSKCSTPDRIACTVGTSAAARVCLPLPAVRDDAQAAPNSNFSLESGLFCYRIDRNHVLVGGALTDGGSVVEWASQLLNLPVPSDAFQDCLKAAEELLEKEYRNVSASQPRKYLTMVPFLSGERSTGFRSGATGAILGLTRDTAPPVFLKGCLEGVTLRMNAIVSLIQNVIASLDRSSNNATDRSVRIICSGKALEVNSLWRRMLSDATGLAVVMDPTTEEGTSRGVARLVAMAAMRAGNLCDYDKEEISDPSSAEPNGAAQDYWDRLASSQEALIDAVTPLFGR
jgi:gluconokinase